MIEPLITLPKVTRQECTLLLHALDLAAAGLIEADQKVPGHSGGAAVADEMRALRNFLRGVPA